MCKLQFLLCAVLIVSGSIFPIEQETKTNIQCKIEMAAIPGGTFQMGGANSTKAGSHEITFHAVTMNAFFMSKTEVTQGQWKAVMGANPANFQKGDDYPVENVSWDDCQEFIRKLNENTGKHYRLPTEAEWEYACRAGTTGETYGATTGKTYGDVGVIAWYESNSGYTTHAVGQKQPNAFGLYDMLGNVWEWCQDLYDASGLFRVFRGGCWFNGAEGVRVFERLGNDPGMRSIALGLRLVSDSTGN